MSGWGGTGQREGHGPALTGGPHGDRRASGAGGPQTLSEQAESPASPQTRLGAAVLETAEDRPSDRQTDRQGGVSIAVYPAVLGHLGSPWEKVT